MLVSKKSLVKMGCNGFYKILYVRAPLDLYDKLQEIQKEERALYPGRGVPMAEVVRVLLYEALAARKKRS